jgi:hypothetical protein
MASPDETIEKLRIALGFLGPQAEAAARSLALLSTASYNSVSANNAQAEQIRDLIAEQVKYENAVRQVKDTLFGFGRNLIDTADSMSSSTSVFTQISPMIDFLAQAGKHIADAIPDLMSSALGLAGKMFAGPAGAAIGSSMGKLLGEMIGGTLEHLLPIAASIFNQYLKQGEKVIQAFNALSTAGVTFGGSVDNMNRMIANTNMPLEMLAKIAQQNAENLALLGGGVSGALERVAKAARNDLGPQLVTLYGGFANLSDELVDYLAMQQRRGITEDLLSAENIEGTKAYLYQLKEVSALTGKSTKQLRSEMEARNRSAAAQAAYNKMSKQQQAQFDKVMNTIPEALKAPMQDVFLSMSRGMMPVSTAFQYLTASTPELADSLIRIFEGTKLGQEGFNEVLDKESKKLAASGARYTDEFGDILVLRAAGKVSASVIQSLEEVLTSVNSDSARLKTLGENAAKFAKETETLAKSAGSFTTTIESIYAAQSNLAVKLNSLILGDKDTPGKISEFGNVAVAATDTITKFVGGLNSVVNWILGKTGQKDAELAFAGQQSIFQGLKAKREEFLRETGTYQASEMIPDVGTKINDLNREQQQKLQEFDRKILEQQKRVDEAQKIKDQSANTSSKTSTTGTSISSTEEVSVKTAGATKLHIDSESIAAALKPMIDHQNILINDLKIALAYQGDGINRAVNRMA